MRSISGGSRAGYCTRIGSKRKNRYLTEENFEIILNSVCICTIMNSRIQGDTVMPEKKATISKDKTATKKKAPKLVIVESPAKAKTIAKYLGKGYKVEASNGHVRDLPKSQLGIDVQNGFEPKYITIRGRGEIIDRLKREAKTSSGVLLATDPDREGEAISWHLAHVLNVDTDSLCRIEFNEITKDTVKKAIKNPRRINSELVDAQQARRLLDRLVGYEISPILWRKVHKGLSAGRVQSVATRIVCDRESEIEAFVPDEYWSLSAELASEDPRVQVKVQYVGSEDAKKRTIHSRAEVDEIVREIKREDFVVASIDTAEKHRKPAPPFTTSSMQQEASRKYGFSTKRTMILAQQLYEGVDIKGLGTIGLVTYIRTDYVRIAEEAKEAAKALIVEEYGAEYYPEKPNQYKGRNGAQDAHEAIRPTTLALTPKAVKGSLTRDQYRLYCMIYNRFIASQMSFAIVETNSARFVSGNHVFRANSSRVVFPGYQKVYQENDDEETNEDLAQLDKNLAVGLRLALCDVDCQQHFTEPPARYSEATLVRTLEELGIGRPSTYAPIISTILDKGYVRREGRILYPTELGQIITNLMKEYFNEIVDVTFTAEMEKDLDEVECGEEDWKKLLNDFYGPFSKLLEQADKSIEKIVIEDEKTDIICEKCGAQMVIKNGRNGKFYACPNFPTCRNTKSILQKVDANCPKCGGQIIIRHSRKGRVFYGCENYPVCDFNSWDLPVNQKCPKCGSYMVQKKGRNGLLHVCANPECGETVAVATEEQNEAN